MAVSKLILYRSEITPDRNMWIENIHEYLQKKAIVTYSAGNFQYQKIQLNTVINIAVDQEAVGNQSLGNYCEIIQENKSFFYFITEVSWTSKKAVSIALSLDTVNTFGEDLEFSDKTTIQREHQNRFSTTGIPIVGSDKKLYFRHIDREIENIQLPKELVSSEKVEDSHGNVNWFLIYKTRDDLSVDNPGNPIEADLVADKELLIKKGRQELPEQYYTDPNILQAGKFYYLTLADNPGGKIQLGNAQPYNLKDNVILVFWKAGSQFGYKEYKYTKHGNSYTYESRTSDAAWGSVRFIQSNFFRVSNVDIQNYTDILNLPEKYVIETGSQENITTIAFNKVERTDSRLMKIIRLPYCPIEVKLNYEGEYVFPEQWEFKNRMMRLNVSDLSTEFLNKIDDIDYTEILTKQIKASPLDPKSISNESKLLSSEFRTDKFVYDSFVKEINLENIIISPNITIAQDKKIKIPIEFKATNTINSKFAFKFDTDFDKLKAKYKKSSDYEDYLIVARNNEETIFSNDYLNYIRNGYNYDIKAKTQNAIVGGVGIGIQALGAAAGFGLPVGLAYHSAIKAGKSATISAPVGDISAWDDPEFQTMVRTQAKAGAKAIASNQLYSVAAIGAGLSLVNSTFGLISSQIQAQQAIDAKLNELSHQATNVSGSDDVDLLQYYNGNRLEHKVYDIKELSKKNLYNLFFLTGYSHPVQEVPNLDSRYWFNFIQCSPIFKHETTNTYSNYLTDIKARFEKGITKFHFRPGIGEEWDLDQNLENWETTILN